jgi:putative phage-type endonuclease
MKVVLLKQGSAEWLEYRLKMRNASETAAVLGESPWMTPYQLWLLKTGRSTTKTTVAMQHGTDLEPLARTAYEERSGNIMQPVVLQEDRYSASLDGMDLEGQLIVEIKCPFKGQASDLWTDAVFGRVPGHYMLQIQHQLMVSGAALAHLWVFDGTQGILVPIEHDPEAQDRIKRGWEVFQNYLDTDVPPPLTEADTVIREDADWAGAAKAFAEAKRLSDAADAELAKAREALVGLARHPKETGAGVSVTRYWKAGAIDYKKIPALKSILLEEFRGKAREEVRVTAM